jgi:DNA-binding transcriptional LysR family regulator
VGTRITLRQLEYLVAVGECGSIALAAEKVNVSSPSISAAISQLEAEFGLQLFIRRHAQGLSLTTGGAHFVEQARRVLTEARALDSLANDISRKVRGPLRVGCLVTFAALILPQLRRSFVAAYPEVSFHQFEGDQAEIFEGLRTARLDVALTYDMHIPPDLTFLPLSELPPYALMDEAHPLAGRASLCPADLAGLPMVLLDLPISSEYFLSYFSKAGLAPLITERTRDISVMRSLVANGFGYSMANLRPPSDQSPDGRPLRYVPLAGPVQPLHLGLTLSQASMKSGTIRTFVEYATLHLAPRDRPFANTP